MLKIIKWLKHNWQRTDKEKLLLRIVKLYLFIYVICYFILPLLLYLESVYQNYTLSLSRGSIGTLLNIFSIFLDRMQNAANAFLAFVILIMSLQLSTVLFEFFQRITNLGIDDVEHNRKGSEASQTGKWIKRIRGCAEVTIIGTSSRGWFDIGFAELKEFLEDDINNISKFNIYLLDPFGKIWTQRVSTGYNLEQFLRQYTTSLSNLKEIINLNKSKIQLYLYDTSPISCVIADKIYLGIYLPYTSRKVSPELTILKDSMIGKSIYENTMDKMSNKATKIDVNELQLFSKEIDKLLACDQPDKYMSHNFVTCDFCKEIQGRPTSVNWMIIDNSKDIVSRLISTCSPQFYLMPTIGPIVHNHMLLLTAEHLPSMAVCSIEALEHVKVIVDKAIEKYGDRLFCFEHGMPCSDSSYGGCGISHAHLHILPMDDHEVITFDDIEDYFRSRRIDYQKTRIEDISNLINHRVENYIFVMFRPSDYCVYTFTGAVESQLMRKFLCDTYFKSQQWDWRKARLTMDEMEKRSEEIANTLGYKIIRR